MAEVPRFGIRGEGLGDTNEVTGQIIDAALTVHKALGPGLLERIYVEALVAELEHRGLQVEVEVPVRVTYRGAERGPPLRLDLLVEGRVIVEVKAVEEVLPVHKAQLLTYLRVTDHQVGLLINFNVAKLKDGIHRRVSTKPTPR